MFPLSTAVFHCLCPNQGSRCCVRIRPPSSIFSSLEFTFHWNYLKLAHGYLPACKQPHPHPRALPGRCTSASAVLSSSSACLLYLLSAALSEYKWFLSFCGTIICISASSFKLNSWKTRNLPELFLCLCHCIVMAQSR